MQKIWALEDYPGPIVVTAIHAGHRVRREVDEAFAIHEADRLREEDPFTERWLHVGDARLAATFSCFQVDLNRPRERAVYRTPDEAWGLEVWRTPPSPDLVERSLAEYDAFFAALHRIVSDRIRLNGSTVVLDLHSYNHRRGGPFANPDDPAANPEVCVGTASMNRERWADLVDAFMRGMRGTDGLDVRENVRFLGGHMVRWLHATFPDNVCALAVDVKKTFMDEWSGTLNAAAHARLGQRLSSATSAMREALGKR